MLKKQIIKQKPKLPEYDPFCPKCNVWWDKKKVTHIYCCDCGTELIQQSECIICGQPIDGQWAYCATCGVRIIRKE